jgi:hypothetical protein
MIVQINVHETVRWWDSVTQRLVDTSTIAFVFLLLPQLIKNGQALAAGNAAVLAGLAWEVRACFQQLDCRRVTSSAVCHFGLFMYAR